MKLSVNEKNAFEAVKRLLSLRKVSITATTLKNKLLQEPSFPSLLSLVNVLTDYNIFSIAITISPDMLRRVPLPAIAYFENGMGYVTINKIENNQVEWYHDQSEILKESLADFSQKWQGIVLVAKAKENSGEENFATNLKLENIGRLRMPFIYVSLAFILSYFIFNNSNNVSDNQISVFYNISFIKIIGLILSVILIRFNIYFNNSISESTDALTKMKNEFIKNLNLESRKIFSLFTWSEIGLIYFIGSLFSLFLLEVNDGLLFIKWLNLITIPYTLWAVYYQIAVIQKWCLICVGAMLLLWIEFYFLVNTPLSLNYNNFSQINLILVNLLLVTVVWVFIRKHLFASIANENLYNTFQKVKFSSDYVKSILGNNQFLPPIFDKMQILEFGNQKANHTALAVLNPNSALSAIKFDELTALAKLDTNINCKVILVNDSPDDLFGSRVIQNIFTLSIEKRLSALSDWFKYTDFKKCSFSNDIEVSEELLVGINENINWVCLAGIPPTAPTVYLDNCMLPSIYTIKDVSKLLRILASKF